MTEIEDTLPPAIETFVLRWGDLGGQWGVNRSVAQIHALLYASDEPLTAERIAARLGIARSNVSTSLRELVGWRLVQRVPVRGDRRDHYVAITDLWEMVRRIAAGRKERELDPAAEALEDCLARAEADPRVSAASLERLRDMHGFVEQASRWHDRLLGLPLERVATLMNAGDRIAGAVSPARRRARAPAGRSGDPGRRS